ncbi:MAG: TVP38/TMEM64 family protein [Acidobacteriota bacterium]
MDFSSVQAACDYIRQFGVIAPLVAFVLFFVQAVLPVFPYFILATSAGILFGFWMGFGIAWSGALSGACFAFFLVRITGWEWLHRHLYHRYNFDVSQVSPGFGFMAILLARIFPVIPTPLINVVSAISGISFWTFLFASAIGKIPTALLFTGLGQRLNISHNVNEALFIIGGVFLFGYIGVRIVQKRGWLRVLD